MGLNFTRNLCGGWNDPFYFHENGKIPETKKTVQNFFGTGIVLIFDGFQLIEKRHIRFTILFLVGLIIFVLTFEAKLEGSISVV